MQIVRTVVPELPSTTLEELNDPNVPKDMYMTALPFKRVIMEAKSRLGPARLIFTLNGKREIAQSPSFSKQFCHEITRAQGDDTNYQVPDGVYNSAENEGAVRLWA